MTFNDLANFKKGPFGSALKKEIFVPKSNNVIKVYEQQNAINKDWKLERYFITKTYYEKMKSFTVYPGDIIVSCAGTIGELYVLPKNADIGIINQALMLIRPNGSIIRKDYFIYIFEKMIDTFTLKFSNGSAIKNIPPFADLKKHKVWIPSLREQDKIVELISKIDDRIQTQSKIIEDLEVVKKGISNTIFGDKSVIKKSWKTVKLSTILKERKTYDIKDSVYPHATLSKEGISAKTDRYNRDFLVKDEEKEYKITHLNDICYNPANLKFGVICLNTFGDAIFSPIYVTYEIDNQCDPYFISLYLTNPTFIGHIRKYEQGTVYERMAVSSEDFLKGEIHLPTYEEQLKIAKTFKSIDEKIAIEQAILDKLKEQKKFLLSNMFI